jgi:hypothetical protein
LNPCPRSIQVGDFEVAISGGIWVAIRGQSVRCGADMASARWRSVLDQPSPAAWPGLRVRVRVRGSCGTRPTHRRLRAHVVVVAPSHWSGAARYEVNQWPAASHVVCAPPTLVLRRCAASALRTGLPIRPPGGSSARAPWLLGFATSLVAGHARNTWATGLTACQPAWRWLTFGSSL